MTRDYANKEWLRDAIALEAELRHARCKDDRAVFLTVMAYALIVLLIDWLR